MFSRNITALAVSQLSNVEMIGQYSPDTAGRKWLVPVHTYGSLTILIQIPGNNPIGLSLSCLLKSSL
jgi:hypothetical protein